VRAKAEQTGPAELLACTTHPGATSMLRRVLLEETSVRHRIEDETLCKLA
jgi:hypothetical protein